MAPDHMQELWDLLSEARRKALGREPPPDVGERFNLESGLPLMCHHFADVEPREWRGEMVFPNAETLAAFCGVWRMDDLTPERAERLRPELLDLARERSDGGTFRTRRHGGAFVGYKR